MKQKRGFTLIELSIVLVIIALVVSGILFGKDMISSAQLRSAVGKLEAYSAAVNAFKGKYEALPGDIYTPEKFGLGINGGIGQGGDGNGQIFSYRYFDTGIYARNRVEIFNFFYHLAQAGLSNDILNGITITGAAAPTDLSGYMPRFGYGSQSYVLGLTAVDVSTLASFGNAYVLTTFNSPNATISCTGFFCSSFTAAEAMAIDSKLDDGLPGRGNVLAMYPAVGPYWSGGSGQSCGNPGNVAYDVNGTRNTGGVQNPPIPEAIDCHLMIKASW